MSLDDSTADTSGAIEFTFGKHNGNTFANVYTLDKSYIQWARKEVRSGQLQEFVIYCNARSCAEGQSSQAALHHPAQRRSFGVPSGSSTIDQPMSSAPVIAAPMSGQSSEHPNVSNGPDPVNGAVVFPSGKYAGKTFEHMFQHEKGFVSWARKEPRNGWLLDFIRFCDAKEGRVSTNRQMASGSVGNGTKRPSEPHGNQPASKRVASAETTDEDVGCEKCHSTDLPFPGASRCGSCWKEYYKTCKEDFYIRSNFEDKEQVRARGARWDAQRKKWFVPAGRDISMLERWHILCTKCGEPLSDMKLPSDPICLPECKVERDSREREERKERERKEWEELSKLRSEEAERRKAKMKVKVKDEFVIFIKEQALKIQAMMADRNQAAIENEDKFVPFIIVEGGLEKHVAGALLSEASYNPFCCSASSDADELPECVVSWMRGIGSKDFAKNALCYRIDYRPEKILDWAVTFHKKFIDSWIDESVDLRCYVHKQMKFVEHLLHQCLDPVTPDLKLLIQQTLRERHGTCCPDVVGIFGSKILPRIRLTLGDVAFAGLTREQKCDWCVVEYMQHRKGYDSACKETEETTYMRDLLNKVILDLSEAGSLSYELNEDENDALYFPSDVPKQRRMFMLRLPNTAAADLFSMDVVEAAIEKINSNDNKLAPAALVEVPTVAEFRKRIFAVFRTLHWRIARKLAGGSFAVYGVADGLRVEDGDVRMAKVRNDFPEYHQVMLDQHWAPRDFCGHDSKRLHSNTDLIDLLFVQHLGMQEKVIKKTKKTSEKFINDLRKKEGKEIAKMKKGLGPVWRELVDA